MQTKEERDFAGVKLDIARLSAWIFGSTEEFEVGWEHISDSDRDAIRDGLAYMCKLIGEYNPVKPTQSEKRASKRAPVDKSEFDFWHF